MPKLKTKSGVKKRFRLTGTGKVISTQSKKRHGMIKRTKKQIRQLRGTTMMHPSDAGVVKKSWMPYGVD
jgi:large subunit ribosomal protein L35